MADTWPQCPERRDHIGPETSDFIVVFIQRDPGDTLGNIPFIIALNVDPVSEQGAFAKSGRGRDERKLAVASQSLIDTLFPLEAIQRRYNEELELLERIAQDAGWSTERLAEAKRRLADDAEKARQGVKGVTKEVDLMATAASEVTDEGEILPSPTDYEGIYGKTLETLEAEWLAQLQGSSKHVSPLADDETDGLFRFALKGCCQHLGRMHGLTSAPM